MRLKLYTRRFVVTQGDHGYDVYRVEDKVGYDTKIAHFGPDGCFVMVGEASPRLLWQLSFDDDTPLNTLVEAWERFYYDALVQVGRLLACQWWLAERAGIQVNAERCGDVPEADRMPLTPWSGLARNTCDTPAGPPPFPFGSLPERPRAEPRE